MTTYTFDRVTRRFTKKVPCAVCGKPVERSKTEWMTSSPFNGWPTREELRQRLGEREAEWQAKTETHKKCEARNG